MKATIYLGRRLSCALFLDRLKSGSFKIQSRNKATVDAHGMSIWIFFIHTMHHTCCEALNVFVDVDIDSSAWVFCALLVLDWMGKMPEPQAVERATDKDTLRFFIL